MEKENTAAAPANSVEQPAPDKLPGQPDPVAEGIAPDAPGDPPTLTDPPDKAAEGEAAPAQEGGEQPEPSEADKEAARRAEEKAFWDGLEKEADEKAKGQPDTASPGKDAETAEPPGKAAPAVEGKAADKPPTPGKDAKKAEPPGKAAPAAEEKSTDKAQRGGKRPAPDKSAKAAEPPGKPAPGNVIEMPKRPGRPPKAGKDEKAPGGEKPAPEDKAPPAATEQKRRGRPPKEDKSETAPKEAPPAPPVPAAPEPPPQPRETPRPDEPEQIVYIKLGELHAFKDHPFQVRDDHEMQALVESVRLKGVNQPALVRPRPEGGYEIIAGHRRQRASEKADLLDMPCIVRNMTDDEAILAMTDDNLRQRSEILPSERAASLKMQVDAIKRQGARTSGQDGQKSEAGKTAYDIVAARNSVEGKTMSGKQVQRYVWLTRLVPDLMKRCDDKSLGFTTAVELSYINRKNQNFIAVAIDAEQSVPSQAQAKRLREMDDKGQLNSDVIDAVLGEKKKEEIKVIISGAELDKYFGKDKTPQQMKEHIIKLLDEDRAKEKGHTAPDKKPPER